MNTLASYHDCFVGETGWVFGKGRTGFDYDRIADITGPCFFINDSVVMERHVTHDRSFWFCLDHGYEKVLPTVRSLPVLHRAGWADGFAGRCLWWHQDPTAYNCWPADLMAHSGHLLTKVGTVYPLIHFAWFAGIRKLCLIGCDGIQKLDQSSPLEFNLDERIPNLSGKGGGCVYGRIRKESDRLMDRLGITANYIGTPAAAQSEAA
jgi:hypothetical protein